MNILFVCSANLNRGPAAARISTELANKRGLQIEVQSAGTQAREVGNEALRVRGIKSVTQLTNELIDRADIIIALDSEIKSEIEDNYQAASKEIIDLDIIDRFNPFKGNLEALEIILNQKLEPLIEEFYSRGKRNKEAG